MSTLSMVGQTVYADLLSHSFPLYWSVELFYAALKIRSKWWIDKCPSIITLGHTIFALHRHNIIFGEHICHSRYVSTNNESIRRHSQYK